MKKYSILTTLVTIVLIAMSCNKDPLPTNAVRKIQYQLYTNKDFSNDNDMITFSVFMKNHTNVLLDSALAPMKIKDIPDAANKIVIEKTVPNNDTATLSVGFRYTIDGVGNSWYLDTCSAGQTLKVVDFPFQ